ncbi:MAG: hypothetical protein F2534_19595 [Actinobacteria bacterium]|uniref:Unannotated protein n=1 Tax=freshwater metagenome TaxID=449393 RepID=A0A6J6GVE0_9ZZZZ|nr:hypothetical protein [Actinomycetota bacterium]
MSRSPHPAGPDDVSGRPVPSVAAAADQAGDGDSLPSSGSADTEEDPVSHLARGPECWLCVAVVGGAGPAWSEPVLDRVVGPAFVGVPVLGSDGTSVVAIGTDPDGVTQVWSGPPQRMEVVGEVPPGLTPVSITHDERRWHVVVSDGDGRSRHLETADLVTWRENPDLVEEFPNLVVRGMAATAAGLVLLGEVVVRGRWAGWTLLESVEDGFRARELQFPVTPEHRVVGPVTVGDDDLALVIASPGAALLARTSGGAGARGWAVSVLEPDVAPTVVTGDGGRLWVAGRDPAGGSPMVVLVGGRAVHLDRRGGEVVAGVMHRGELVIARQPIDVQRDPPAWLRASDDEPVRGSAGGSAPAPVRSDPEGPGRDRVAATGRRPGAVAWSSGWSAGDGRPVAMPPAGQSSPAYIDSISVA